MSNYRVITGVNERGLRACDIYTFVIGNDTQVTISFWVIMDAHIGFSELWSDSAIKEATISDCAGL